MNQCFCRDTSDIKAGTAYFVIFYDRYICPQLSCLDSRNISARACANDDDAFLARLRRSSRSSRCRCSRSGSCWCSLGSRFSYAFAGLSAIAEHALYRKRIAFLGNNLEQYAIFMSFYYIADFIRFDFNDFVAFFDGISFLFQPGRYCPLSHGQTQLGHRNFSSHHVLPPMDNRPPLWRPVSLHTYYKRSSGFSRYSRSRVVTSPAVAPSMTR